MDLTEEQLNKPRGVLIKTTLVDFPGRVASTVFLEGCNLRCPYCYNTNLVLNCEPAENLCSIKEITDHLEKRQKVLTGFVISGGEALLNPATPHLIQAAKKLNLKVKLDTNGTLPDLLEKLIANPETKPDFIAMDIKTSPQKYSLLLEKDSLSNIDFHEVLKKSIDLISTYPTEDREFRTVLVPPLITKEDIKNIAELLPKDASWQFAQFRNENCLNPDYNEIIPYLDGDIKELVNYAKTLIPGAALR